MSPVRMQRVESGVRLVIAFIEAYNSHDVPSMMQLVSDDCIFEDYTPSPGGALYKGKQAVTQFWQDFFLHSPQAHLKIEETFGYGFRCVVRWRYDWVDEFGKQGYVRGVDLYQLKNGLISEKLSYVKG